HACDSMPVALPAVTTVISAPDRASVSGLALRTYQFLYRVDVGFDCAVCSDLQASHNAPVRVVRARMVEPEMRAAAFRAYQRGGRKNAPEQRQITHCKRALQLFPPHLIGAARSFVEAHSGHIFALDPIVLRQGLPECTFLPDG